MCEAEFPNQAAFRDHQDLVHGGQRWFQSHYIAHCELAPYVPSPTEGRQVVERFAKAQECATTQPVNRPYRPRPPMYRQQTVMWAEFLCTIASHITQASADPSVQQECQEAVIVARRHHAACMEEECQAVPYVEERRAFKACSAARCCTGLKISTASIWSVPSAAFVTVPNSPKAYRRSGITSAGLSYHVKSLWRPA